MAGFRGVGDDAMKVIESDKNRALQSAQIGESARQANMSAEANANRLAESSRQADMGNAQDTAKAAENTRQFDAAQSQKADQFTAANAMAEKQYGLDEFKTHLIALTSDASLAGADADTQMKRAQLKQYLAATEDEQRQAKNRENLALGTFASLGLSAAANGGTIPLKAGQIAANDLGIKKGGVRGYTDFAGDGYTTVEITDDDGKTVQKRISPEQMYATNLQLYGKETANMWAKTFSQNQTVSAGIQRKQLELEAANAAKQTPSVSDKVRAASVLMSEADKRLSALDKDPSAVISAQIDAGTIKKVSPDMQKQADDFKARRAAVEADKATAMSVLKGSGVIPQSAASPSAPAPTASTAPEATVINETERASLGIPAEHVAIANPDGTITVTYRKDGQLVKRVFQDNSK